MKRISFHLLFCPVKSVSTMMDPLGNNDNNNNNNNNNNILRRHKCNELDPMR